MKKFWVCVSILGCLCIAPVFSQKEDLTKISCEARSRLSRGICPKSTATFLNCVDACTGKEISSKEDCGKNSECCFVSERCVFKKRSARFDKNKALKEENALFKKLKSKFQSPRNKTKSQESKISARNLQLGGFPGIPVPVPFPSTLGGFPQTSCVLFPFNCPPVASLDQIITPPVNIPYCQREYCSQSDLSLENDMERCLLQPGCYFDRELHTLRRSFGHQVLPTVPVCHLVIRNHNFLKRTQDVIDQLSNWNPSVTQCLLMKYNDEIYSPPRGCDMNAVIEYFGYAPKMAGWSGINENECYLINGCWRSPHGCFYPMKISELSVKSSQKEFSGSRRFSPASQTFGMPKCQDFDSSTPAKFLKSYHICLSSGCALDPSVSSQLYYYNLWNITQSLPTQLQYLSWVDIANAVIRADNFEEQMKRYQQMSRPDQSLSFMNSLNSDSSAQVSNFLTSFNPLTPFVSNPFNLGGVAVNSQINQLLGSSVSTAPFLGSPFLPVIPSVKSIGPTACPFQQVHLYNFPPLKGSFTGCCEQNLCYLPRKSQNLQRSGIASYYSTWGQWSTCTASCGGGDSSRSRKCIRKKSSNCYGVREESRKCNTRVCPQWSDWARYAPCSVSCGGGKTSRTRECVGIGCVGKSLETAICNSGSCPTYSYWTPWSKCSATCGKGEKVRLRECIHAGAYGCRKMEEKVACRSFCGEIYWTNWSDCDHSTCTRRRTPSCEYQGKPGYCQDFTEPQIQKCDQMKCYCRRNPSQLFCNL